MSFDNGCLVVKSCSNGVSETLGNYGKSPWFLRCGLFRCACQDLEGSFSGLVDVDGIME